MIGGGGRSTGAGARRFSVEKDRKTLRGLLETVAGDVTAGAGTFVAGLADMTAVTAATAKFSLTATGDGDDADVRPAALFDVISFGAVVETTGVKVAAFDGRLLDVSCDVILYAVAAF